MLTGVVLQNLSHMLPMEFSNLQFNADASRKRMEELYSRDPDDHKGAIGCLATVDKFTAALSEDRRQEEHKGNECICIVYILLTLSSDF